MPASADPLAAHVPGQDAAARGPQRTTAAAATATAAPAATAAAATAAGAPGPVQAGGSGRSWLLPCFGWAIVLVVVILIAAWLQVKRATDEV